MAGIANSLNEFTENFEDFFNDNILSMLSEYVGSYYGIFGAALLIYLTYNGVRIALGWVDGKEMSGIFRKAAIALFFLLFGYSLIPAMDYFGEAAIEYVLPTKLTSNSLQNSIDKSQAIDGIRQEEHQLSSGDIERIQEAQSEIDKAEYRGATIDNAKDFDEDGKSFSIWGMLKSGVAWIFSKIFLIIGALCKMIITFFILVIKGLLRITFPIAVSLSLIFKAEKALEAWWESYITVVMMGVIIAAISALQNLMIDQFTNTSLDSAQLGVCLMAFAFGIAYLCAPTFTVMCFGGSQAAAQLPQQISTAMMGVVGLSVAFSKNSTNAVSTMYRDSTTGATERFFK